MWVGGWLGGPGSYSSNPPGIEGITGQGLQNPNAMFPSLTEEHFLFCPSQRKHRGMLRGSGRPGVMSELLHCSYYHPEITSLDPRLLERQR